MPRKANDKKSKVNNENEVIKKPAKTKSKSDKTHSIKKTSAKTTKAKTSTNKKSKTTTATAISKSKTTKSTSRTKKASTIVEYYDLPFRYNQTIVKILAQTPNKLFIYWDISDDDRKSYIQKYGEDFFKNTKPYLVIKNETMNYSFEVEINDFANSWYLNINDASCKYKVELIRKFIVNSYESPSNNSQIINNNQTPYFKSDRIYITSSNGMEMPNNHILFDKLGNSVFFRNTKTNIVEEKNISSISFLHKIGKVYNIYDLYKQLYKDELVSDEFGVNIPSSSSSSFK